MNPISPSEKISCIQEGTAPVNSSKVFSSTLFELFSDTLQIQDKRVFGKLLEQAFRLKKISWKKGDSLSSGDLRSIEVGLKETLVYHGKGIIYEGAGEDPEVHEIIQYLLAQGPSSKEWLNMTNAKGIFLKADPALLSKARDEIRVVLKSCGERFPEVGTAEELLFETFIGNIIALLPYFYPVEGEAFTIPLKVDGVWKNVPYVLDKRIELTPKKISSPITAYGLTSVEGPPLLTFIGTTFPAGEGYLATLFADFTPGHSVGDAPYRLGEKKIEAWLEDKEGVQVYGASLGGALSFQLLRRHPEKIARIDAYNPPGLYPWDWKGDIGEGPVVNIYCQENDLVPSMGMFPQGERVNVYRIFAPEKENALKAHARVFTGSDPVTVLKSDPAIENSRFTRRFLTALHFIFGIVAAAVPFIILYLLYYFFGKPVSELMSKVF